MLIFSLFFEYQNEKSQFLISKGVLVNALIFLKISNHKNVHVIFLSFSSKVEDRSQIKKKGVSNSCLYLEALNSSVVGIQHQAGHGAGLGSSVPAIGAVNQHTATPLNSL